MNHSRSPRLRSGEVNVQKPCVNYEPNLNGTSPSEHVWLTQHVQGRDVSLQPPGDEDVRTVSSEVRCSGPTSEEDLCPICYAHSISAVFKPCSHKSCKACINQHLMNNKDCFFCKATITGVEDYTKPASS
ncbi:unnamed protein product [Arctogadus glacialis]